MKILLLLAMIIFSNLVLAEPYVSDRGQRIQQKIIDIYSKDPSKESIGQYIYDEQRLKYLEKQKERQSRVDELEDNRIRAEENRARIEELSRNQRETQRRVYEARGGICADIRSEYAQVEAQPANTGWEGSVKNRHLYDLRTQFQKNSCK